MGKSKEGDTELFGIRNNGLNGNFWFDTTNPIAIKSNDLNCDYFGFLFDFNKG